MHPIPTSSSPTRRMNSRDIDSPHKTATDCVGRWIVSKLRAIMLVLVVLACVGLAFDALLYILLTAVIP